jgi:hypothetical protein
MKVKNLKDFCAGLMFIVVGSSFAVGAKFYELGSASQMGPGYFPLLLSVLLIVLGIAISCQALTLKTNETGKIGSWAWRPLIFILGANLVFGVLLTGLPSLRLPAMGMVVGIYGLTITAGLASRQFKIKEALILATALAVGSVLVFITLLKLQIPVLPSFITG